MAAAMNAIGYDAAALGNHEFNYGIPYLRTFEKQLDFPLLAANATNDKNGRAGLHAVRHQDRPAPARQAGQGRHPRPDQPRDRDLGQGERRGADELRRARRAGREVRARDEAQGCRRRRRRRALGRRHVVVLRRRAAVPGERRDARRRSRCPASTRSSSGHAHQEIAERVVTNTATGKPVVLSEPLKWGQRLSVFDIDLSFSRGRWTVQSVDASVLNSNTVPEDPKIVSLLADEQQTVVDYVNGVIGTSTEAMSAATARYEDTAVLDFINYVQAGAVKAELTGADADLPVLSIAAPFNKDAAIPQGDVSVRDIAGLYIYDNTLLGIKLTGAQVKAYLEKSAEYFKAAPAPGTYPAAALTNAVTPTAPNGTPDYNYDVMGGLDQPLTYDIDLAQPVGSRITGLAYGGVPVTDTQEFVVAINNYRQSGGGNFPGVVGGTRRLQPAGRDPAAAHRLGERQRGGGPGGVLVDQPRLAADVRRHAADRHAVAPDSGGRVSASLDTAARPASSRAIGTRNGEHDT